jgi:hypothetical protein
MHLVCDLSAAKTAPSCWTPALVERSVREGWQCWARPKLAVGGRLAGPWPYRFASGTLGRFVMQWRAATWAWRSFAPSSFASVTIPGLRGFQDRLGD